MKSGDAIRTQVLDIMAASPFYREAEAKILREQAKADQKLIDERSALRAELAAKTASLDAELERLNDEAQAKRRAAEVAERAAASVFQQRLKVRNDLGRRIEQIDSQLTAGADERIDQAISDLERRWEKMRREDARVISEVRPGRVGYHDRQVVKSNGHARPVIGVAVREAREALRKLKTERPDDVVAAITAITSAVPWGLLGEMREVRLASVPSDDEAA